MNITNVAAKLQATIMIELVSCGTTVTAMLQATIMTEMMCPVALSH